ncbi:MAG: AmmeMemoRadiSam system protein A [Anaerovoracaceae bacterium]
MIDPQRDFGRQAAAAEKKRRADIKAGEDEYVKLARNSLENYIKTKKVIRTPDILPPEMLDRRAGAFVSLKKDGQLRGCIGTISPVRENLAREIIENAVSAAVRDPRFSPVREDELDDLEYSVDVLDEPEHIDSPQQLDVKKYGVIVRKGGRTGLLLPNLEGVDTIEEQISIAKQKAGIQPYEDVELSRFQVVRHK